MESNGDQAQRESWQDEYRCGAFYLFPPADVASAVDQLRARYDPRSAAICGAHVSLSEPLTRPPSDEQLAEVREVLTTFAPFEITFGPVRSFDPHPGVGIEAPDRTKCDLEGRKGRQNFTYLGQLLVRRWSGQGLTETDVGTTDGRRPRVVTCSELINGGGDVSWWKQVESATSVFVLPRLSLRLITIRLHLLSSCATSTGGRSGKEFHLS